MMISTQNYYESEIKGKNASQIKQLIQSLTYDIHELKEKKEHPNYEFSDRIYPDECTRIAMYRDYIQKAKEELIRLNEKWDLTDEEQRVLNFNHHLDDIKMIEFHYASFF